MRATFRIALLAAALLLCGGCMRWASPVRPPIGVLYTHYRAPLTPQASNFLVAGPEGKSYTMAVREPFVTGQGVAWAQAAVQEAAREGGLKKVAYADFEILDILSVYSRFTVHVYGE
jgi:hypothetical protein